MFRFQSKGVRCLFGGVAASCVCDWSIVAPVGHVFEAFVHYGIEISDKNNLGQNVYKLLDKA